MKMLPASKLRRRTLIAAGVAAVLAALIVADGIQLYQIHSFNSAVAAEEYEDAARHPGDYGRLAHAFSLGLASDDEAAVMAYEEVERSDSPEFRAIAKYNLGNLFMRQAAHASAAPGELSIPLIELAKENYRAVLRANSEDWDARFNLARALQVLPEPEAAEMGARLPRSPRAQQTLPAYERLP